MRRFPHRKYHWYSTEIPLERTGIPWFSTGTDYSIGIPMNLPMKFQWKKTGPWNSSGIEKFQWKFQWKNSLLCNSNGKENFSTGTNYKSTKVV